MVTTSVPLCLRASAISTALDDAATEEDETGALATTGDETPAPGVAATVTEAEGPPAADSATTRPDSVSRFSRFRSALMSDAC